MLLTAGEFVQATRTQSSKTDPLQHGLDIATTRSTPQKATQRHQLLHGDREGPIDRAPLGHQRDVMASQRRCERRTRQLHDTGGHRQLPLKGMEQGAFTRAIRAHQGG